MVVGRGKYSITTPIISLPNPLRTKSMMRAQRTKSKATNSNTKPGYTRRVWKYTAVNNGETNALVERKRGGGGRKRGGREREGIGGNV